ncbi:hypothetical protein [Mesorhizobium sp.]|uniref:hypothetical protein n=1 Tax=Mesorhizobium sp. TaxID=1871066 RepID=UPI000FE7173B|nr:hypothetical protein [Mesorhizobium sp.]RWQ14812.1 MAG: hypothetical protein EOR93_27910 [Mesorhizobium sp.]
MNEIDRDIEDAAASVGVTIGTATETHVSIVPDHGFGFYATRHGWLYARKDPDGSFEAPTSKAHRKRTGQAIAVSDCLDELSISGAEVFPTAAEAIRTTLKNYLVEAAPVRKLSDFEGEEK